MKASRRDPSLEDPSGKLHPDEPYFTLRGDDPLAPQAVEFWAALYQDSGGRVEKVKEARDIAQAMRAWRRERSSEETPE